MQQQIAQQEQYGNQHQISQPMMICPIQYVYETPMLMPQAQERQIQPNQNVMFNVQNTPPWIHNRPQSQVIYVQQVPSNYQTYIHPQMMQNLYHPQINYQIQQPMLAQDNRQFMQIPNLPTFNPVQSQPAQPPHVQPVPALPAPPHAQPVPALPAPPQPAPAQPAPPQPPPPQPAPAQTAPAQPQNNIDEVAEKMPLLTQMLNQKPANNISARAPTNNNVRSNTPTGNNVNPIRPVTHNQQVQTNISANNKGRPRNGSPQIISINPMQQRQFANTNQKPDVLINIRTPITPYIRGASVPQHIRSKIPSSISVKTVHRPIQLRSMMRPSDVMPSPQNFVYNPNFVSAPYPETRNIMTNTDSSYFKQNNNSQGIRTPKPADVNVQTEAPAFEKLPTTKNPSESAHILKQRIDSNVTANSKVDPANTNDGNTDKTNIEMNTDRKAKRQAKIEEKLIRNTVYVQARGRVLNEQEILQNQSLKRTIDSRLEEERIANNANDSQTSQGDPIPSSNKYVGIENTQSTSQIKKPFTISSVSKASMHLNTQQSRINNLSVNFENKSTDMNTPEPEKLTSVILSQNCDKLETPNPVKDLEQKSANNKNISSDKQNENTEDSKGPTEVPIVNNIATVTDESNTNNLRVKSDKIKILTHVLDGYIIQESNVAFPIYKPIMEKEYKQCTLIKEESESAVTNNQCNSLKEESKSAITNDQVENAIAPEDTAEPDLTSSNERNEPETEMVSEANNKDNPFANVQKSTVGTWTVEQLAVHLDKCEWRETAAKLQDEEIDGESLLLVNKEQLVSIGVCENHAEVIAAFNAS